MERQLDDLPEKLRAQGRAIIALLDSVCDRCLNEEYKELCEELAEGACRMGLPLDRGKPAGWAAGIAHSVGWVNFLTDPGQTPHVTSPELARQFGVSQGTMFAKSKVIRAGLNLIPADPDWTLPSRVADNPLAWMVELEGGMIADARDMPREKQEEAFRRGLIPFVPSDPSGIRLVDEDEDLSDEAEEGESVDDEDEEDDEEDEAKQVERERAWAEQRRRIEAIVPPDAEHMGQAVEAFFKHLKANLQLPCEVTGLEDFRWEEPYVVGGWDQNEYRRLKKSQPSYRDRFLLLDIDNDSPSEWMLFPDEDIAAQVRRVSDGKEFRLGLSELTATDKTSPNYQFIDDFGAWLVNNR